MHAEKAGHVRTQWDDSCDQSREEAAEWHLPCWFLEASSLQSDEEQTSVIWPPLQPQVYSFCCDIVRRIKQEHKLLSAKFYWWFYFYLECYPSYSSPSTHKQLHNMYLCILNILNRWSLFHSAFLHLSLYVILLATDINSMFSPFITYVPVICVCKYELFLPLSCHYVITIPVVILSVKGSCWKQKLFFPSYWIYWQVLPARCQHIPWDWACCLRSSSICWILTTSPVTWTKSVTS